MEHTINPTAGLVDNTVETITTTKTIFIPVSGTAISGSTSTPTHTSLSIQTPTFTSLSTHASMHTSLTVQASTHTSLSTHASIHTSLPIHTPAHTSLPACKNDDDNDDDAIFVSIAVVAVGILVTIIIVVVGVILCRRDRRTKKDIGSTDPLIPKKNYGSVAISVGAENDLYGRPEFL